MSAYENKKWFLDDFDVYFTAANNELVILLSFYCMGCLSSRSTLEHMPLKSLERMPLKGMSIRWS